MFAAWNAAMTLDIFSRTFEFVINIIIEGLLASNPLKTPRKYENMYRLLLPRQCCYEGDLVEARTFFLQHPRRIHQRLSKLRVGLDLLEEFGMPQRRHQLLGAGTALPPLRGEGDLTAWVMGMIGEDNPLSTDSR